MSSIRGVWFPHCSPLFFLSVGGVAGGVVAQKGEQMEKDWLNDQPDRGEQNNYF